jgi:hypothetical protein
MDTIQLTFPDGTIRSFPKGSTGNDVAGNISSGLLREALAIEVNGEVRDLPAQAWLRCDHDGRTPEKVRLLAQLAPPLKNGGALFRTKFGIRYDRARLHYDIDVGDLQLLRISPASRRWQNLRT